MATGFDTDEHAPQEFRRLVVDVSLQRSRWASILKVDRAASRSLNLQTGLCRWRFARSARAHWNYAECLVSSRLLFRREDLRSYFKPEKLTKGEPIIDAQHPHDLFMELSATYTVPLGDRSTWFTYFGYPGEPALGPTAFMHRASASENPGAALSHHLQDSSHISFGVFTTGFTYRWFKLEASVFNGREPDENRYNFEAHPWNSRSARLWFAPNSNWAIQVSHGLLRNPEALEEGDVRRTTASVSYNKPLKRG